MILTCDFKNLRRSASDFQKVGELLSTWVAKVSMQFLDHTNRFLFVGRQKLDEASLM